MFETVDIFTTKKRKVSREQIAEVRGVKCFLSTFELTGTGESAYGCHVVLGDDPMKAPYLSVKTELYLQANYALLETVQIAAVQHGIPPSEWSAAVGLE
jgi:hypothetical protein